MKWPFLLYSPHPPTLWPCSYSYPTRICVGSDDCNFAIPHLCLFFPGAEKKVGKEKKGGESSENSRRYYCAACMAPVIHSFHLCFLLYWQMVVIRQYGNTVVKIVFTDFFPLWYLWPDDHHESVVVLNRGPLCQRCLNQETNVCHMGMTHPRQPECSGSGVGYGVYVYLKYYNTPKYWSIYFAHCKILLNISL